MTQDAFIEAAQRGERIHTQHSRHPAELLSADCQFQHRWREIACNGIKDVLECSVCGRQRLTACTFDEDYA